MYRLQNDTNYLPFGSMIEVRNRIKDTSTGPDAGQNLAGLAGFPCEKNSTHRICYYTIKQT